MSGTCFWSRRRLLAAGAAMAALPAVARSARAAAASWTDIAAKARGQTVHFNAWGGDQRIDDYIAWAAGQLGARSAIELRLVKLADTAEAVSRIVAEKAVGVERGGSIDLVWINGENFAALKSRNLLFGPFANLL
ncbi:MAG TPA: hypothetical protein VFZ03_18030, partial [Dongiaceae bacterium]